MPIQASNVRRPARVPHLGSTLLASPSLGAKREGAASALKKNGCGCRPHRVIGCFLVRSTAYPTGCLMPFRGMEIRQAIAVG
jgi:hypothetical protein